MAWSSQAPGCTIDGLSLTGFGGAAIVLEPASATVTGALGDTIWGNFIGVDPVQPADATTRSTPSTTPTPTASAS